MPEPIIYLPGDIIHLPTEEHLHGPRVVLTPELARQIVELAHFAPVSIPTIVLPGAQKPKPIKAGDVASDVYAFSVKRPHPDDDSKYIFEPLSDDMKYFVRPRSRQTFGIGIKVALPPGYKITVESRSGLASNSGIEVGAGLIDNNYHEEIGVVLHNHTDETYIVRVGDRIAQICAERYVDASYEPVSRLPSGSARVSGWGSSGL